MSMHVLVDNSHRPPRFGVVLLLWLLGAVGLCGLHRIYLNRWASGILYLATFGLFGLGQIFDWFRLGSMVRAARRSPYIRR